jgi:hypothetical protein
MKIYVKWNAARFMQISEVKIMFQREKFCLLLFRAEAFIPKNFRIH